MRKSVLMGSLFMLATAFGLILMIQSSPANGQEGNKLNAAALEKVLSVKQEDALHRNASSSVRAPSFTLKALNGETYTIGETNNKPLVLQFWASWCEACSIEAPTLKTLHESYQDKIDFYGINLSSEEKQGEDIKAFIQQNEWTFPILLDDNKRASYLYELHALPTTFIIDADGTVLDTFHLVDPMEFRLKLEQLASER